MNLWKRAVLYLTRKKEKSALLMALLFLMSCLVLLGLSFKESAEREADRLRQSLASGFVVEANLENEMYYVVEEQKGGGSTSTYAGPLVTDEMIEKILAIDGVEDYKEELTDIVWTDLELRKGMWADAEANDGPGAIGWTVSEEQIEVRRKQTYMWPCRKGELHKNFRTGALTIAEGRNIQEGDSFKAVISEELAERNGLSVGDAVTLEIKEGSFTIGSDEPMKTWGEPMELEIVGLFHVNFEQAYSEYMSEGGYVENNIYVDMDTHVRWLEVLEKKLQKDGSGYSKVEFLVNDPGKVDEIMQQVENSDDIDMENLLVTVDNTAYQAAAAPYNQIRVFALVLLAVGAVGLGIVLFLVMKLWVQNRKHEAGVLLSVGIGKGKILGQILAESLLVSVAALLLAFLLSGTLLDRCAGLAERATAPRADAEAYEVRLVSSIIPDVIKTSSDEVVLDHEITVDRMLWVAVFVCGISSVSVLLAFRQISSIEPKKLLRSM